MRNKLVFSTFHQTKGLQRKAVFVFNFDESYYKYYNKSASRDTCPNELYVAVTRAQEHLVLFHHHQNDFLPFIATNLLPKFTSYHEYAALSVADGADVRQSTVGVTDLTKHLSTQVTGEALALLDIHLARPKAEHIHIQQKVQQSDGSTENVSEITGTAIPALLELQMHKTPSILVQLQQHPKYQSLLDSLPALKAVDTLECQRNFPSLLLAANSWNALNNGYLFKLCQLKSYDWVTPPQLQQCAHRLQSLQIHPTASFEHFVQTTLRIPNTSMSKVIVGYVDCMTKDSVYEFKCVSDLRPEHFLQLAIYMLLIERDRQQQHKQFLRQFPLVLQQRLDADEVLRELNQTLRALQTQIEQERVLYISAHPADVAPGSLVLCRNARSKQQFTGVVLTDRREDKVLVEINKQSAKSKVHVPRAQIIAAAPPNYQTPPHLATQLRDLTDTIAHTTTRITNDLQLTFDRQSLHYTRTI